MLSAYTAYTEFTNYCCRLFISLEFCFKACALGDRLVQKHRSLSHCFTALSISCWSILFHSSEMRFSHFVMASVGVSALGRTNLHFVDPDFKINGQYYRDTLLMTDLLPDINQSSPDYFTFQQDGAPAHRARETVNLLRQKTPDFIPPDLWPSNNGIKNRNPVDYKIWGSCRTGFMLARLPVLTNSSSASLMNGTRLISSWLTVP